MKSNLLKPILAVGFFLLPTLSLHATVDSVLKIDLNSYYQSKKSKGSKFASGKVTTVRVDSKQLLKLLGQEKGVRFPSGSRLMVTDVGYVYVANSKGQEVIDAAPYVQVAYGKSEELFDGKVNVTNGKENARTYSMIQLSLDFPTLEGTLEGVAIEKVKVNAPDRDGIQKSRTETKSTINGEGVINGGTGYFDGKVNLKGRGAVIR